MFLGDIKIANHPGTMLKNWAIGYKKWFQSNIFLVTRNVNSCILGSTMFTSNFCFPHKGNLFCKKQKNLKLNVTNLATWFWQCDSIIGNNREKSIMTFEDNIQRTKWRSVLHQRNLQQGEMRIRWRTSIQSETHMCMWKMQNVDTFWRISPLETRTFPHQSQSPEPNKI